MQVVEPKGIDCETPCLKDGTVLPCCKDAKTIILVEAKSPQGEYGYIVVATKCECPSRFIRHDWRLGKLTIKKGR